jgi:hypothetical protein
VWLERTAKSCGPDVAVLALSPREAKLLGDDGGKRAVRRGEHEVSRKATAQGRPGCSACTCMLVCAILMRRLHTRPRVQRAPGLPCALRFRGGANDDANLGRKMSREHETISTSLRAQRRNPALRLPSYGLLRFARNDGSKPQRTGSTARAGNCTEYIVHPSQPFVAIAIPDTMRPLQKRGKVANNPVSEK